MQDLQRLSQPFRVGRHNRFLKLVFYAARLLVYCAAWLLVYYVVSVDIQSHEVNDPTITPGKVYLSFPLLAH